ncbi:putative ubiquitin-conjugating enzyme E2 38 [Dioscorea cayenensis subsp. rotundata]|uniref:Ubiquitin-conjugating enzyme E2 38 n=1 Tax=Dioscorea cayennensis subsp. rotundata TaxID=55577 RepID=A0AB40B1K7_DIOCR|nr:putative ubiquitin-conjugating enzyme E2 38 [Dioscorea cayenensis subsp. rotundata]
MGNVCFSSSSSATAHQRKKNNSLATESQKAKMKDLMEKAPVDEIDSKFRLFKQFDSVQDYSDHHFRNNKFVQESKLQQRWIRKIRNEWTLLEKHLPEMIYVRIYEDRMDLLRAVIVGPAGTPYHNGLFFFDFHFPEGYPNSPPLVYHHSHGLGLNPNLYANGVVCVSLLNTWVGSISERWNPVMSTMLQVLVSIQGLILNERPYFNEPLLSYFSTTRLANIPSRSYNADIFLLSCKKMLYNLRKPPKHLEDFVAGHFRTQGRTILRTCKAYMAGVPVGTVVTDSMQLDTSRIKSSKFSSELKLLFVNLLEAFCAVGAECNEFL